MGLDFQSSLLSQEEQLQNCQSKMKQLELKFKRIFGVRSAPLFHPKSPKGGEEKSVFAELDTEETASQQ